MFRSDIEILVVWWPQSTICLTLLSESCCERFLLFKSGTKILVVWWALNANCLTLLILNLAVEDFFFV